MSLTHWYNRIISAQTELNFKNGDDRKALLPKYEDNSLGIAIYSILFEKDDDRT